jgi:hypothetical protein
MSNNHRPLRARRIFPGSAARPNVASVVLCIAASAAIELTQQRYLPSRVPSLEDVRHNSIVGALGACQKGARQGCVGTDDRVLPNMTLRLQGPRLPRGTGQLGHLIVATEPARIILQCKDVRSLVHPCGSDRLCRRCEAASTLGSSVDLRPGPNVTFGTSGALFNRVLRNRDGDESWADDGALGDASAYG